MEIEDTSNHKKNKISFCTVCMNRLEHLKKTLTKNILDNIGYEKVEFVVIDYNSQDGLETWMKTEMKEYIDLGILVYLKLDWPKYFLRSHSKNIAAKKASGDIVCNVDADNFIGQGFAEYINKVFQNNQGCYLTVSIKHGIKDFYGRICISKVDFMAVSGYDESMTNYGFEDFDIQNRLNNLGRFPVYISDEKYLKALNHNDEMRIENEQNINEIKKIYIRYINHYSSELLYLFNNGTFYKGTVLINKLINSSSIENIYTKKENKYDNSLENNKWISGKWHMSSRGLNLFLDNKRIELVKKNHKLLETIWGEKHEYYECEEQKLIKELVLFFSEINNRIKMVFNMKNNLIKVNSVFGEITTFE